MVEWGAGVTGGGGGGGDDDAGVFELDADSRAGYRSDGVDGRRANDQDACDHAHDEESRDGAISARDGDMDSDTHVDTATSTSTSTSPATSLLSTSLESSSTTASERTTVPVGLARAASPIGRGRSLEPSPMIAPHHIPTDASDTILPVRPLHPFLPSEDRNATSDIDTLVTAAAHPISSPMAHAGGHASADALSARSLSRSLHDLHNRDPDMPNHDHNRDLHDLDEMRYPHSIYDLQDLISEPSSPASYSSLPTYGASISSLSRTSSPIAVVDDVVPRRPRWRAGETEPEQATVSASQDAKNDQDDLVLPTLNLPVSSLHLSATSANELDLPSWDGNGVEGIKVILVGSEEHKARVMRALAGKEHLVSLGFGRGVGVVRDGVLVGVVHSGVKAEQVRAACCGVLVRVTDESRFITKSPRATLRSTVCLTRLRPRARGTNLPPWSITMPRGQIGSTSPFS
jgi:hypothetical protein